ncbi:hypothetical protein JCM10207_007931 [Rhodosporidiobolus poonsookiae]
MGANQSSQQQEQQGDNAATADSHQNDNSPASTQQETVQTTEQAPAVTAAAPAAPAAPPTIPADSSSSTSAPDQDVFKVPALPSASTSASATSPSSTLRTLPADIEHILSLNAHEPDEALRRAAAASGRELQDVVRELRERQGFATEEGEFKMESEEDKASELSRVEKEMEEKGVKREEEEGEVVEQGQVDEQMDAPKEEEEDVQMEEDSSDDSSDTDSGDESSDLDLGLTTRQRARGVRYAAESDGSDDEGGAPSNNKIAPKTEHEMAEPDVKPLEVQKLDEKAELAKFGKVESVITNVVVLRADTAGDWRVLDEGTVVCWEDRTVIGAIFETFGSVQQPFYSLRFPTNSPPDPAVFTLQRPVFYCPSHAQFVFTRDLRNIKGSDASNIWDEEVGANEVEFSDDEEEAEYRRRVKADRRARTQSATPGPSRQPSAAPPSRQTGPTAASFLPPAHLPARPAVSYADTDDALPSTSSSFAAAPMSGASTSTGPRAEMGTRPPPGRVGRRMFERDTGRQLEEGEEVEFEFSSGDEAGAGSDDEDERRSVAGSEGGFGAPAVRGGRGARGGRGRGGAERGAGRGARGRGRGRGGAEGGRGGRQVAPLPARASPGGRSGSGGPSGLPSRPSFQSDLPDGPEGGIDAPVRMSAQPAPPPSAGPAFKFGAGGGEESRSGGFSFGAAPSPQQAARSPPFQQQQRPPPPQQQQAPAPWSSSAHPHYPLSGYGAPPPPASYASSMYGASRPPPSPSSYYAPPPSAYPSHPPPASHASQGYSPHQPYATAPPPPAQGHGAYYNPPIVAPGGGHVNPRFLAQQQAQQQQQQQQGVQQGYYGGQGGGGYGGGWR